MKLLLLGSILSGSRKTTKLWAVALTLSSCLSIVVHGRSLPNATTAAALNNATTAAGAASSSHRPPVLEHPDPSFRLLTRASSSSIAEAVVNADPSHFKKLVTVQQEDESRLNRRLSSKSKSKKGSGKSKKGVGKTKKASKKSKTEEASSLWSSSLQQRRQSSRHAFYHHANTNSHSKSKAKKGSSKAKKGGKSKAKKGSKMSPPEESGILGSRTMGRQKPLFGRHKDNQSKEGGGGLFPMRFGNMPQPKQQPPPMGGGGGGNMGGGGGGNMGGGGGSKEPPMGSKMGKSKKGSKTKKGKKGSKSKKGKKGSKAKKGSKM